jgi:anti-sigma-K factor RskA
MTGNQDLDELAAEYVLGLLEGRDGVRAEALFERDPAFQAAVSRWRAQFSELDATADPMPASEALWQRIDAELAAEREAALSPAPPVIVPDPRNAFRALWHNLAFWRFAGLATTAASLLLAGALYLTTDFLAAERARKPTLVAILVKEGTNEPGAIVNTFANGQAELIPLEIINVPPDRALQIWTLWDRARGPVSVGLVHQARSVRLDLQNLPIPGPDQLFEITLEPAAGSPTGRPTGPILMKGTTATAL